MDQLSNTIYSYYIEHLSELLPKDQFHFASRLYLWNQDAISAQILTDLKPWFTFNDNPRKALQDITAAAINSPLHGSKNAAEIRRPYFERYPMLKTYVSVLFRIAFLKTIYDIDASPLFYELFSKIEVDAFANRLNKDNKAISILSTHAINFLYLYNGLILQDTSLVNPESILKLGQTEYKLGDPIQLQLRIYLYTHCIIGDTLFYFRPLPEARLKIYQSMIAELGLLMEAYFTQINLDNKFEFLACCKIVGKTSLLEERIMAEASESISEYGSFLIDRLNYNPQVNNITIDKSEHRNVLFIMASSQFTPIG